MYCYDEEKKNISLYIFLIMNEIVLICVKLVFEISPCTDWYSQVNFNLIFLYRLRTLTAISKNV